MEFNLKKGLFKFIFDGKSSIQAPTILYVPKIQYPKGYNIKINEGTIEKKEEDQLVLIKIKEDGNHIVNITRIK